MKKLINAEIVRNTCLTDDENHNRIFELIINDRYLAEMSEPGQFVEIYLPNGEMILPRPISICETDVRKGNVTMVYSVVGKGTDALSKMPRGSCLKVMGPIGKGFEISDISAVLVIGGGIGVPPLLMLVKELYKKKPQPDIYAVLGFRNSGAVILEDEFSKLTDHMFIATDDGSTGFHGNVLDCINSMPSLPDFDMIYSCGPKVMLKGVSDYAASHNIPAQISMEERMACGLGACVGCAVKIRNGSEFEYKKVCKDGPVFYSKEVAWE